MRHIFIDAGSHKGQSITNFNKCKIAKLKKWEIFGFEPHPKLHKIASQVHKDSDCQILSKAVWTKNQNISFYQGADPLSESHTAVKGKKTGNIQYGRPLHVEAIDFSNWIESNFVKDSDFIILKMDIEGGEYDVLEKMIADDTLSYINVLFIEWHAKKLKSFPMKRHDDLVQKIKNAKNPSIVITEDQVTIQKNVNWFPCLDQPRFIPMIMAENI